MLSVIVLIVPFYYYAECCVDIVILSVVMEWHYAVCHYAERLYAEHL
jgi:hypothetical protein